MPSKPTPSGREHVEEALRESDQLLALSQRMAHLGSWDWTPDLLRLRWSDEVFRIFGEPVGAFVPDFNGYLARVHPDDRARVAATIGRASQEYTPFALDHSIVRPDGEVRHVHCEGEPVVRDDQPSRLVGTIHDQTQQRQAESERAASEVRLRRAQRIAGVGDWSVDLATGRILWSDETYRLFQRDRRLGPPSRDELVAMFDPPSRARLVEVRNQRSLEEDFTFEVGLTLPDGRHAIYEATVCHDTADARPKTLFGVIRDVTGLRLAERERTSLLEKTREALEQAQHATRAKDHFLAVLSHELRTPMTTILTWAQLLRRGTLPAERQELALSRIERAALIQRQIISDMLDVSRIESGKVELSLSVLSAAEALRGAVEQIHPEAQARSIQLVVETEDVGAALHADATRLQQVFVNLLGNAVKFSPDGGRVVARLETLAADDAAPHGRARFMITDTGRGIRPDFLPSVFDRFAQADPSETRQQGGLGLGLTIVKSLVERHGGRVSVHSDGEGLGARFEVELPLVDRPLPAGGGVEPARLDGLRVMLVEDDESARRALEAALEQAGAQVRVVPAARPALELLQTEEAPDVLVCDIGMPGESGYWLLRQVRALPGPQARVPALALTAYASDRDRAAAFEAGFDAHVSKPVDLTMLLAAVGTFASRQA